MRQSGYGQTAMEQAVRRARVPLGFAFAAAFLLFARPDVRSLLCSLTLVVPGLWLRGYAAGYVKKNAELTTTGPYAQTRNPLYLGSLMAALGFVAASRNAWLVLTFLVLFTAVYLPVILSEERFLAAHFPGFNEYIARVPRLFPRPFSQSPKLPPSESVEKRFATADTAGSFSLALYRRHREYNAAMGAVAIYAALGVLLALRQHGILPG